MNFGFYYETAIGKLLIVEENEKLTNIFFQNIITDEIQKKITIKETKIIKDTITQIYEYLDGKRTKFNIPIELKGTEFQKQVWNALTLIPYGKTSFYQEIAQKLQSPKACRAVGMANNKNPIPIIFPCHRVIGKNGSLVGYAGGLEMKKKLLEIERRNS